LFDSKQFDKEAQEILWSPNTYEKLKNGSIVSLSDGFSHTRIDTIFYVSTKGKDYQSNQAIVIFKTVAPYLCHPCTGVYGVATFEKYDNDKVWHLRAFQKMLIETGGYGESNGFEIKNLGKDENGSDFNCLVYNQGEYGNFGHNTGYNYLFSLNGYKQIFRYKSYDSDDSGDDKTQFTEKTEIVLVKTKGVSKIELVTKRSEKDIFKSVKKRLFEYSDELGTFVPVCTK
jgi:hypothetical protein